MNKKSLLVGALAGFGAAAWSAHRNKKYPLAKGYALLNKFSVPGAFVCAPVSALGNAVLQKMPLPAVPAGAGSFQLDVTFRNFYIDVFFNIRQHIHRRKRSVPPRIGVKRRYAHQAVHSVFAF